VTAVKRDPNLAAARGNRHPELPEGIEVEDGVAGLFLLLQQ
jgi:hypothetical protein